jgi:Sulfotransferase family
MPQSRPVKISFGKINTLRKRVIARLSGRRNVHLLHLRKTGGTALKHALAPHQILPGHVLYFHPHRIKLEHIPGGDRIMFVTRDPVSRYVSGFLSRLRQGAPSHDVPWRGDEEWAFSQFPTPNALALALDPQHPAHENARRAMNAISHIRYGYWEWFGDEAALEARQEDILFIGRLEHFAADFEALGKSLNLPPNVSLPADAKGANRSQSSSEKTPILELAAVEWIKHWYARDYDFLDFCENWRAAQGGPVARSARR